MRAFVKKLKPHQILWVGSIDLTVRCPFCLAAFKIQITAKDGQRLCPACHARITMRVEGEAQSA